jgi:hypothetical protein
MWWEILIVGSLWFNLMAFGWFCLLVWMIEEERGTVGSFLILAGLGVIQLFSDFNVVAWLWHNPMWVAIGAVGYFVIGAIWGTTKWTLFSRDKREKYDEEKEEWLRPDSLRNTAQRLRKRSTSERNGIVTPERKAQLVRWADACTAAAAQGGGELTDALKPAWTNSRDQGSYHYEAGERDVMPTVIPHPKDHKARILRWMGHWPWSLFWTLLNDPIRRIAKMLYKRMSIILVSIGQRSFAGTENDFVVEPTEENVETTDE